MAVNYDSPHMINFKSIVDHMHHEKLSIIVHDEHMHLGALILVCCDAAKRKQILFAQSKEKQSNLIQSLVQLKQPPDFVLETLVDELKKLK
jgi:flagellar motor switch protein FliG